MCPAQALHGGNFAIHVGMPASWQGQVGTGLHSLTLAIVDQFLPQQCPLLGKSALPEPCVAAQNFPVSPLSILPTSP